MSRPRPIVLVATATSSIGSRAVQAARDAGYAVRALVRNPRKRNVRRFQERGIEIVHGDLLDHKSLRRAVDGADYIIGAASVAWPQGRSTPHSVTYEGMAALIDAALHAGVRQFVLLSTMGAARLRDPAIFEAHTAAELTLAASGLTYTIIRPSVRMHMLARYAVQFRRTGVAWLIGRGESRISPISPDDLALIAVRSLGNERVARRILRVGGPEELRWRDLPPIFSRVYARPARVLRIPPWLVNQTRVAVRPFLHGFSARLGLYAALNSHDFVASPAEVGLVEETCGVRLERLEEYLRRTMGGDTAE